jgi:hypothetical protein
VNAIKTALEGSNIDEDQYIWRQGGYNVAVITPVLNYWLSDKFRIEAQKQKDRRSQNKPGATRENFRPLDDLKQWAEYLGEYKPTIQIEARPSIDRDLRLAYAIKDISPKGIPPMRLKFKTDFYRMKLLCGNQEVEPIHPGKIENVVDVSNATVVIRDVVSEGIYTYPADAISTKCSTVTLQIFSPKEADKPESKTLSPKTIARITADFAPLEKK